MKKVDAATERTKQDLAPSGTAAERVAKQQEQQSGAALPPGMEPNPQLSPDQAQTLARARKAAREIKEAAASGAQAVGFASVPTPAQAIVTDASTEHEIRLRDGRVILLAPPLVPMVLVLPSMFKNLTFSDSEGQSYSNLARMMNYVRRVNDVPMPQALTRWEEVVALTHNLGELGTRAVIEAFYTFWPEGGGAFWEETKKNNG